MRIGVGSGNPVKRRAVERVVDGGEDDFAADAAVEAVPVPSGVSEQPTGHAETTAGARNRAAAVLDAGDYDLGVGIEGGVARFGGAGGEAPDTAGVEATGDDGVDSAGDDGVDSAGDDGLYLVMWAAVDDGERVGRGAGPAMRLPDRIADRVEAGEELGPVMDDVLGEEDVAREGGAAGAFTSGRVDRAEALSTAVAGALGPFVTDLYDE